MYNTPKLATGRLYISCFHINSIESQANNVAMRPERYYVIAGLYFYIIYLRQSLVKILFDDTIKNCKKA